MQYQHALSSTRTNLHFLCPEQILNPMKKSILIAASICLFAAAFQPRRQRRSLVKLFAGTMLLILGFAPTVLATNIYFDVNGATGGFGAPVAGPGNYTIGGAFWTTDINGVSPAPGAFAPADVMCFGGVASDFNGSTFQILMSSGSSFTSGTGINVISTNANIMLTGSDNTHPNSSWPIAVAGVSTLAINDSRQAPGGLNWNNASTTFTGTGTNNFLSYLGANCNNSQTMTINMPASGSFGAGSVNLNWTVAGTGTFLGKYTLTAGNLNFQTTAACGNFLSASTANPCFNVNGGTIDNTSGASQTLAMGANGYSFGGNFTFNGSSSLSFGTAPVVLTGTRQLTVNANTLTIGGVVSGNNFGVTKTGAGTLSLIGANTYSGATTVNQGKLNTTTASTGGGSYAVTNGSTLNVKVAGAGQTLNMSTLTLGASGADTCSLQIDAGALGNPTASVVNATNLAVNGTVTVNLLGTALATGTYTILTNAPGLRTGGGSFTLVNSPRISATLNDDTANNRVTVTITTTPDGGIVWDGAASGNWDINNTGNTTWKGNASGNSTYYSESAVFGNDTVMFNDAATGTTNVSLTTTLAPLGITVSNTAATPTAKYTFSSTGKLSGTTGLTKRGSGTLTLAETGGDNFSGGLSISNGTLVLDNANSAIGGNTTIGSGATLQVGNGDANGNLPGAVANNGSLIFNRSDTALTASGVISGSGAVTNNGSGTVTLSAVNTFTGPTVVNAGTLALAAGNINPSTLSSNSSLTINNGGIVQVNTDNSLVGSSTPLGGLPVTINAGGTLTGLSTADGGAGTSSHIRGVLTLNGGTLAMGGTQIQAAFGSWDLDNGVVVNGGTATSTISALSVIPDQAGGTVFNVAAGGTASGIDLNVTGTFINGSSGHDSGIIKLGAGTMAFAAANTYAGNTTISNGTLLVSGSLGGAGTVFIDAGILAGAGTVSGSVTNTSTSAKINQETNYLVTGAVGTLTLNNNLNMTVGGACYLDLGTAYNSGNDLIVVGGTLTLNNNVFHIKALNGAAALDTTGDYVLVQAGSISGTPNAIPTWDGTPPGNSGNFTVQLSGNNIVLHYAAIPPLAITSATASPSSTTRYQSTLLKVTVTNGVPAYAVTVDASLIGGGTVTLITNGASGGFTNTISLTGVANGSYLLPVSVTDSQSSNAVANISLNVTSASLTWNGNVSGDWNTGTANWQGGLSYADGDFTRFDDTLTGTTNINLTATRSPASLIVSNTASLPSANYTFSGGGNLSGSIGLLKQGSGTLTLAETGGDNFNGGISVSNGTVVIDNDSSTITGGTTIGAGGTVQLGNNDANGVLPAGTLTDNGALVFNRNDTALTISAAISGSGTVTNNGSGTVTLSSVNNSFTGGLTVNNGTVQANGTGGNSALGSGNTTVNVNGTLIGTAQDSFGFASGHHNPATIFVNGGTITENPGAYRITLPNLTFTGGTLTNDPGNAGDVNGNYAFFGDGTNQSVTTLASSTTAVISAGTVSTHVGITIFNVATGTVTGGATPGVDLLVSSVLKNFNSGVAGTFTKSGPGVMVLSGINTYTGATTISNGTLKVDGSLAGGAVTVVANGTLTGIGTIGGAVTANGTIAPGSPSLIGKLTCLSTVTLNGTNVMKLNKTSQTNDVLSVAGGLAYGGVLNAPNQSGTLTTADSFVLFSTPGTGAFAGIVPATPGAGLLWNTNTLKTDGTLRIVSAVAPTPRITGFSLSGTTLNLTATNGAASGQYVLLQSTNLALPLANWTPVLTNNFDGSGNLNLSTNIVNPANPQTFYILSQ